MKTPETDTWTVAQAEARLDEIVDKARHGPQAITREGERSVVVVDAALWERTQKRERRSGFADFLAASPLRGSGIEVTRLPGGIRDIDV